MPSLHHFKDQEIGFTKASKSCMERVVGSSSRRITCLELLLHCQCCFILELWLHLKEIFFLGLGLTITGIYIKKVQKQDNKTLEV